MNTCENSFNALPLIKGTMSTRFRSRGIYKYIIFKTGNSLAHCSLLLTIRIYLGVQWSVPPHMNMEV